MKRVRMVTSLLLLSAVVGGILFIPFPSTVWCLFELQPHNATSVYVEVPGILERVEVEPGDKVEQGQLLALLDNTDLEIAIVRLTGERNALQEQLKSLEQRRFHDEQASDQISVVQEKLVAIEEQLVQQISDAQRLRIEAPVSGTIIAPPPTRSPSADQQVDLPAWSGTLFDPENLGAMLMPAGASTMFCQIGDPNQWEAILVIDQNDIDLVQQGQEVRMMFNESTYHVYISTIGYRAADAMEMAPPRLASTSGGPMPAQADPDGVVRPLNTSYQAVARLDNQHGLLRNGLIGQARVKTRNRTIASRLYRYLSRTFNFEL